MNEGITRREAAGVLGVALSADTAEVKRRYRRLARDHHPDRGGDAETFQSLHRAYQRLVADDAPTAATVSRGRPSREAPVTTEATERVDLGGIDWDGPAPGSSTQLDERNIAVWLARTRGEAVRALEATSRAPGSRLNRVSHLLSPELTSTVRVHTQHDDRRGPVVAIEIVGANRRARKALDRVGLPGEWVRRRRSSSTQLTCVMAPSHDPRATAVRVSRTLSALLDDLNWPLTTWRVPAGE